MFYCSSLTIAQQRSTHDLHRENWQLINPASFSTEYLLQGKTQNITATGRYQWSALEEPPTTIGLQYQNVVESKKIAFGGSLLNDQTGAISNTELRLNGAYQLQFESHKSQFLSIGLAAAMVQYRVNFDEIIFSEPTATVSMGNQTKIYPDFSFGAFYYLDKTVYAGISVPQLFSLNTGMPDDFVAEREPYIFGTLGGFILFGKTTIKNYLEPSVLVKYAADLPVNLDFFLRYSHQNRFWLGSGYNTVGALNLQAGFWQPFSDSHDGQLKIGFGYTYRMDSLSGALGHTFELILGYAWGQSDWIDCPKF